MLNSQTDLLVSFASSRIAESLQSLTFLSRRLWDLLISGRRFFVPGCEVKVGKKPFMILASLLASSGVRMSRCLEESPCFPTSSPSFQCTVFPPSFVECSVQPARLEVGNKWLLAVRDLAWSAAVFFENRPGRR